MSSDDSNVDRRVQGVTAALATLATSEGDAGATTAPTAPSKAALKRQHAQAAWSRRNDELAQTSRPRFANADNADDKTATTADAGAPAADTAPCFTITQSPEKGREARAVRTLAPGTLVIEENAFCFCIRASEQDTACSYCCAELTASASPSPSPITCPSCTLARCCSTTCWSHFQLRHRHECVALQRCREWAQRYDVDEDLCRILIATHSRLHREHARSAYPCDDTLTLAHLRDMSAHNALFPAPWHTAVRSVCEQLLLTLPRVPGVDVGVMHAVAVRVNTNAHAMLAPPPSNRALGLGLFLRTALLNHSCYPNCMYVSTRHGRMLVRSLREIGAGDELTVSYIDMYMARESRLAELRQSRGFVCTCARCTEPMRGSIDRLVGGVWCGCEASGSKGPNKKSSEVVSAADADTSTPPSSTVAEWLREDHQRGLIVWNGRPRQPPDETGARQDYLCTRCGKRSSALDRQSRMEPLMELYRAAQTSKRSRQYAQARGQLETLLQRAPSVLPSLHELVPSVHVQLYNLCMHERRFEEAAEHARAVVERYQVVFPPNWSEIADFRFAQGEALIEQATSESGAGDAERRRSLLDAALSTLSACHAMRVCACGESHARSRAVLVALDRVRELREAS